METYDGIPPLNVPHWHGWTRHGFERAIDDGVFAPHEMNLELVEGTIKIKPPKDFGRVKSVYLTHKILFATFDEKDWIVRCQSPVAVSQDSLLDPIVAVVEWRLCSLHSHPVTATLVVEVSNVSYEFDSTVKQHLYAQAGIPEYWIVNLNDRVLEVHREPAAMAKQLFGHHYRAITRYTENDTVSPLAAPDARIAVADLLP